MLQSSPMADKLTAKQARFVQEYMVDLNATQAAIRTGYAPKSAFVTGSRLLSNAKILAAVNEAREIEREFTKITAAEVVEGLRQQVDLASDKGQHNAAIRALELLGKHDGQFTDRLQLQTQPEGTGVLVVPQLMTPDEWVAQSAPVEREAKTA